MRYIDGEYGNEQKRRGDSRNSPRLRYGRQDDLKYALVSKDSKRGYLSLDGSKEKLFEDASAFCGGYAGIVKSVKLYVISKNLEKVSEGLEDFESVGNAGKNVFRFKNSGKYHAGIYTQ